MWESDMPNKDSGNKVMDADDIRRAVTRIAHEIIEKNKGAEKIAIIGIQRRGVPLAQRLAKLIEQIEGTSVPVGSLNVALYRDDYATRLVPPSVGKTEIDFDVSDRKIVLVDEVIYTGRTTRSALDALMDMGRPAQIQLAALIDRGHRELPVQFRHRAPVRVPEPAEGPQGRGREPGRAGGAGGGPVGLRKADRPLHPPPGRGMLGQDRRAGPGGRRALAGLRSRAHPGFGPDPAGAGQRQAPG